MMRGIGQKRKDIKQLFSLKEVNNLLKRSNEVTLCVT